MIQQCIIYKFPTDCMMVLYDTMFINTLINNILSHDTIVLCHQHVIRYNILQFDYKKWYGII